MALLKYLCAVGDVTFEMKLLPLLEINKQYFNVVKKCTYTNINILKRNKFFQENEFISKP